MTCLRITSITIVFLVALGYVVSDNPCQQRAVDDESIVCVCNATYCDTISREVPKSSNYVAYTSSKAGQRFEKTYGNLSDYTDSGSYSSTITLDLNTTYQSILGFGGAVTDSAAMLWKNLSSSTQQHLIGSYYSKTGVEYTMIRVPIGGSDFSTHAYAYNEYPVGDTKLSNFSLAEEDFNYKIPMIQACKKAASANINVLGSTWSPPTWMKTSNSWYGLSRLKEEYYQTYADYHLKFIEAYKEHGIDIWGITTTNEPANGVVPFAKINSLGWTVSTFVSQLDCKNLGPTIRQSKFNNTVIIGVDDQRYTIPFWFTKMVNEYPYVLNVIDGVGVHWYGNFFTPTSLLEQVYEKHPDKFLLGTEASEGAKPWVFKKVVIGSWSRAENYAKDILNDLNNYFVGWIDWNLCLNPDGGPNWAGVKVDSPIIVYTDKDEFIKQPMFYIMGHFSKFLPKGSKRIGMLSGSVESVAFLTPDDTIFVIILNQSSEKSVKVILNSKQTVVTAAAKSIMTIEFEN